MIVLQRALLYTMRNRKRTALFACFSFFFVISLVFCLSYYFISQMFYRQIVEKYPPSIAVWNNTTDHPQNEIMDRILNLEHITGYNHVSLIEAMPKNFKNAVLEQTDHLFATGKPSLAVDVETNAVIQNNPLFVTGQAELIEGSFPSDNQFGVLIEDTLAQFNNLSIGDQIMVEIMESNENPDENTPSTMDMTIIGIYRLTSPIQLENERGGLINNPNSRLFVPYQHNHSNAILFPVIDSVDFFLDSYDDFDDTFTNVQNILQSEPTMMVQSSTFDGYVQLISAANAADQFMLMTIIIFLISSISIFIFLLVMLLRHFYYDIGVLVSLGETKHKIRRQFCMQVLLLSIIPILLAVILSVWTVPHLPSMWLGQVTSQNTQGGSIYNFEQESVTLLSDLPLDWMFQSIVIAVVLFILICFLFVLLSSILYNKQSMNKMFSKMD